MRAYFRQAARPELFGMISFNHRFLRFLLVGGTCYVLNFMLLFCLTELVGIHYLISVILSFVSINCAGYIFNRKYTFTDTAYGFWHGLYKYNVIMLSSCAIVLGMMYCMVDYCGINYLAANIIITTGITFYNFFLHKKWTFS